MNNENLQLDQGGWMDEEASKHFASNLDDIINAIGIGMWDWDLVKGKIIHSGQLEWLAGYKKGEMPGGDISARDLLIHPDDRESADATIEACRVGKISNYEVEFRIRCKDGSVKWVQDRGAVASRDKDGMATRIVGMFYDVNRFKQTEESLTEKMRMLDIAAGLSGLGTVEFNVESGVLSFDNEFTKMFGYKPEELPKTSEGIYIFIHPDDVFVLQEGLGTYIAGGEKNYSQQLRILHKDGHYVWIMVTARITEWDQNDKAKRIVVGCLNVDKLIRAEQAAQKALEEERRNSETMFNVNPYMSLIIGTSFELIDCNPATLRYFGYSDKTTFTEDFVTIMQSVIPEYQPDGAKSIPFSERARYTIKHGFLEFETTLLLNESYIPMNIIMKRINFKDQFALAVYLVDVTNVKQTENLLRLQDKLLHVVNDIASRLMETELEVFDETLKDSLRRLGSELDVERVYVWKNEEIDGTLHAKRLCAWSGVSAGQYDVTDFKYETVSPDWQQNLLKMKGINELTDSIDGEVGKFLKAQNVKSLLVIPIELRGRFWGFLGFDDCENMKRVFTESEERVMRSAGMLIAAAVLRNEMMESLVAAKEAALESTRAKSNFLSRMSHEIRTPMNAIIGMTGIAGKSNDIDHIHYCIDKIDKASYQLLDIINDVLDMSKIEANKLEINNQPFDLRKTVEHVYDVVNVKMEEKHIDLSIDYKSSFERKVCSDDLRISQVLINLLSNAAKFTPEHGNVSVSISHSSAEDGKSKLHVEVKDSGIGISDEEKERLFNAFEQADGSTTRKYGGTGLGLAICKSITNMMGGDIWIQSEVGKGSNFIFEIMFEWGELLSTEESIQALAAHKNIIPTNDWSEKTILLVEDIDINREIIKAILDDTGVKIRMAIDGIDGIEVFESEEGEFDLILMDMQMPRLDGLDATRQIREIEKAEGIARVPIIAMTANAFREDVEKCLAAGMDGHLAKPIDTMEMIATLSQYLSA